MKLRRFSLRALTLFLLLPGSILRAEEAKNTQEKVKVIALTEIVPHASLELAKAGILAELKAEGFVVGKNLKVVEENAQGSIANANLIAKKFVGMQPDLIISISTPSTLAVKNAAKGTSIPIVFSSVSDPVAAGIVKSLSESHPQITGAFDSPMIKEMQILVKTFLPKAKRLGVIYNSGEANSVKAVSDLKAALDPSLKLVEVTVPSSNLVADAMRSIVTKVDAIYIPLDNTVVSALPKLLQIANENKIPTFSNDPEHVVLGAFASYGYSQYAVGQTAGAMAAKILKGEKVMNLRISLPPTVDVSVNQKTAKLLSISVPAKFNKVDIKLVN